MRLHSFRSWCWYYYWYCCVELSSGNCTLHAYRMLHYIFIKWTRRHNARSKSTPNTPDRKVRKWKIRNNDLFRCCYWVLSFPFSNENLKCRTPEHVPFILLSMQFSSIALVEKVLHSSILLKNDTNLSPVCGRCMFCVQSVRKSDFSIE